jgi:hypothetical protein
MSPLTSSWSRYDCKIGRWNDFLSRGKMLSIATSSTEKSHLCLDQRAIRRTMTFHWNFQWDRGISDWKFSMSIFAIDTWGNGWSKNKKFLHLNWHPSDILKLRYDGSRQFTSRDVSSTNWLEFQLPASNPSKIAQHIWNHVTLWSPTLGPLLRCRWRNLAGANWERWSVGTAIPRFSLSLLPVSDHKAIPMSLSPSWKRWWKSHIWYPRNFTTMVCLSDQYVQICVHNIFAHICRPPGGRHLEKEAVSFPAFLPIWSAPLKFLRPLRKFPNSRYRTVLESDFPIWV